ncbi:MAG TPA: phosphatase domain-containing protein [Thermoanaerobaculia bacterium]|nr:phosphatase domain-containing protein [Thermoanaerobaculia bacterium]
MKSRLALPSRFWVGTRVIAAAVALLLLAGGCRATPPAPETGRQIVFFPSLAASSPDGKTWLLTVQGRILEPAEPRRSDLIQAIDAWASLSGAGLSDKEKASRLFLQRVGYLLSDSVGGERVSIRIGDRTFHLPAFDQTGYFTEQIPLAKDDATRLAKDGVISFESVPTTTIPGKFKGQAMLVPEVGISVVTDMDDTIKDTDVLDRKEMLRNTFVRPFKPVKGMPELYSSWKETFGDGIQFHVVSAGPWQLNEPLRDFTMEAKFPIFTWQMRRIDIKPTNLRELVAKPYCFKVQAIEGLMRLFPRRHFVLVGDSGEQDPEVYSTILLEFPNRVDAVFIHQLTKPHPLAPAECPGANPDLIRKVPRNSTDDDRYRILFSGAAATKFKPFHVPADLPALDTLVQAHG